MTAIRIIGRTGPCLGWPGSVCPLGGTYGPDDDRLLCSACEAACKAHERQTCPCGRPAADPDRNRLCAVCSKADAECREAFRQRLCACGNHGSVVTVGEHWTFDQRWLCVLCARPHRSYEEWRGKLVDEIRVELRGAAKRSGRAQRDLVGEMWTAFPLDLDEFWLARAPRTLVPQLKCYALDDLERMATWLANVDETTATNTEKR